MHPTATSPKKQAAIALPDLAIQANRHHEQCVAAANNALKHARSAGEALLRAKKKCPHGKWLPWLKANFKGSARTGRAYMQISERWPAIEAKRQRVANLSFRDALRLTGKQKDDIKINKPNEIHLGQFILGPVGIINADPRQKPTLDEFRSMMHFIASVVRVVEQVKGGKS